MLHKTEVEYHGQANRISKKQSEFDLAFEKYSKKLPQAYKDQFKREDNKINFEKAKKRDAQRTGKIEHVAKTTGNKSHTKVLNIPKLLADEHLIEIKTIPITISQQVARTRLEKKLTQEQLAKKISEPVSDIKDLENCKGVYNPNLIFKIEKALNIKIDRPWKKH